MTVELERRKLINNQQDVSAFDDEVKRRAFELSAYFTMPEMEPAHVTLALFSAMNFAHKNKQLSSALSFANSLIEKGTNTKFKETVSAIFSRMVISTNHKSRLRRSRLCASETLTTRLRLTLINLPTSRCAPLHTRRSMVVHPACRAHTMV